MQSIKADPNFATNRWVYVYYSPPLSTPGGDAPATGTAAQFAPFNGVNRLSRFTVQRRLHARPHRPRSRSSTCRPAAACAATSAVTSTSTRPATSTCPPGTTPTRSTPAATRRSTSGPTATPPSTRSAPPATATTCAARCCGSGRAPAAGTPSRPGNMFAPGTANTRPEIYAMGFRNPFRMSVDRATGVVYLGDFGPDSGTASADPRAGRHTSRSSASPSPASTAGRTAPTSTSRTSTSPSRQRPSGAAFNCTGGPVNNSPNNTGITQLPPRGRRGCRTACGQDRAGTVLRQPVADGWRWSTTTTPRSPRT